MLKRSKWIIPQLLVFFILGFGSKLFLAFFWILFHECCHFIAAWKMGYKEAYITISPFGASLKLDKIEELNKREELILYLSGPMANLIMAVLLFFIHSYYHSEMLHTMIEINLILGIFNLMPAFPLDGAKIMMNLISRRTLYRRAHNITVYCSYIMASSFMILFFILIIFNKVNFSLPIASIFIFFLAFNEKRKVMYIIMGDVIRKKRRLINNNYIDNKSISVYYKLGLVNVFALVDKSRFNSFYILDDEMCLLDIIHEDELIKALKQYGNITVEEYILKKNSWVEK